MADSRERGFDEKVNNWVQTFGIIAAAAWALYTFVYKEYWFPHSVPVNVSINLKLQKTGDIIQDKKYKNGLAAIELHISANNPSSQTTFLLPSVFIIYGYKIADSDPSLKDDITLLSKDRTYNMRHVALSDRAIVAVGNLLENTELKPGELVARTYVFYVPVGEYGVIEGHAYIPNGKDISGIKLTWSPDNELGLVPTLFRIGADGTAEAMKRDYSDGYAEGPGKWQTAHSMSMMSLW
jgi:hypothetical protein